MVDGNLDFSAKERSFPRSLKTGQFERHSWGEVKDLSAFPAWKDSSGREFSTEPLFELLDVDMFRWSASEEFTGTSVSSAYAHPSLAPQYFRSRGDGRFFLIFNWTLGPFQHIITGALKQPHDKTWQRFMDMSAESQGRCMRVVPALYSAPWIVHELMQPKKPSMLGKLQPSFSQGEGYLEISFVLTSSTMMRLLVVLRSSYQIIANALAYSLLGQGLGDPRERLLLSYYCSYVEVEQLRTILPVDEGLSSVANGLCPSTPKKIKTR